MPRRARVFVEGMVYHVYNRVGRGEAPFKLAEEASTLWSLMREAKRRDGLTVYAWCIMPNHYHLALRTSTVPLWRTMRYVQHRYSQHFNRRARVFGPLWQSRYKARPVTGHDSLLRLIAYIHLNPVAAKMVEGADGYRWSGHRELVRPPVNALIDVDHVLEMFGGTRRQALHSYRELLEEDAGAPWIDAAVQRLPWWKTAPEPEKLERGIDPLGRSTGPTRAHLTVEEFLQRTSAMLGVTVDALASVRRAEELVEARELVGALAVERWGIGVKELADALGKSRDGVSRWVQRAAKRRAEEAAFAARLEELDSRLATEGENDDP